MRPRKPGTPHKGWKKSARKTLTRKQMTDINFDTIELKNAEVVANVGDKQISAKVEDKPVISDVKVTEGKDEVLPA